MTATDGTEVAVELLTKRCTECETDKPASEFHKDRSKRDGLRSACKSCITERVKQYRQERIDQFGLDYVRRQERLAVERHRRRHGPEKDREYNRARNEAVRVLIERHRAEFEHLFLLARRGEL